MPTSATSDLGAAAIAKNTAAPPTLSCRSAAGVMTQSTATLPTTTSLARVSLDMSAARDGSRLPRGQIVANEEVEALARDGRDLRLIGDECPQQRAGPRQL